MNMSILTKIIFHSRKIFQQQKQKFRAVCF